MHRDFGPRSANDLYILFTGVTTGYPKGVVWRHEDIWRVLGGGIDFMSGERLGEFDQAERALSGPPMMSLPLSPLSHGAAVWATLMHLFAGHTTILLNKFDASGVTPTVGLSHDVGGWSYDGVFNQGRVVLNLKLRAEYDKKFFAEVAWNPQVRVATYDSVSDRQVVSIAAGMKF